MCIDYGTEKREEDLSYIQRILGKTSFVAVHRWALYTVISVAVPQNPLYEY